jgi:hypothetical protein
MLTTWANTCYYWVYKITCGRNSVVECRFPKLEKPKTASICLSSTYIKPHFQAKTELDSDNTVELTAPR